jgi:hypothetical protein
LFSPNATSNRFLRDGRGILTQLFRIRRALWKSHSRGKSYKEFIFAVRKCSFKVPTAFHRDRLRCAYNKRCQSPKVMFVAA